MNESEVTSNTSSRKRSRNALRFKHESRRKRSRQSQSPTRARSSQSDRVIHAIRDKRHDYYASGHTFGESLDPDDEAFYGTGAVGSVEPSLASSYVPDHFTERLFDALADDEGREYWHDLYGQSVDDFVLPHVKEGDGLGPREMTDDEYAAYVRRGMWERKHGEKLRETKNRGGENGNDDYGRRTSSSRKTDEQRSSDHREKANTEARWKDYLHDWQHLGTTQWTMDTVPWPVVSAKPTDISKRCLIQFLSHAGNLKALAKEELRRRWHPDRFQQKTKKHIVEAEWSSILTVVTGIAQILNEIIND